jgi:hypothetical protein
MCQQYGRFGTVYLGATNDSVVPERKSHLVQLCMRVHLLLCPLSLLFTNRSLEEVANILT